MESLLPRPTPIRFTNNHRDSLLPSHLPTTTRLNSPSPKPIFHHPLLRPFFFRFKPKPLPPPPPPPLRNSTALRCTARTYKWGDCEVSQGTATITIEHLTGEIKPLETEVGDRVPGGARNLDGRIIVKATKTWKESTLSRIVQLTEEAQLNKPKLQRWLDQFGEQYSMVVVVLSAAIALLGPFLFKWPFIGTSDFITSLCRLEDTSEKIKQAVNASSYGTKFVRAALSVNEKVTLIHLEDRPRPGSSDVIVELQDQAKLRVMMLTGDHESSAWRVANTVGGGLIIVGEGINDAPDLAAATVGIVLAQRASATATAVADVLLLRDNISAVPFCIAKSCQTTSLVKQSVAFTLSCIILASLPSVLGFLPLWLTVLLHEGGTLLVCLNSIRALNRGPGGRIYGIR
ncbi:hypothetical protein C1H46_002209 [Malus baccata]|uniref:P-type ATPase A domain-containing protein n=1 Tax=Malus baccata TaxID=106549 RepID=A0A540NM92_MALBA|nr:hypothetical protein C1H46_002209 [Malus baccata]